MQALGECRQPIPGQAEALAQRALQALVRHVQPLHGHFQAASRMLAREPRIERGQTLTRMLQAGGHAAVELVGQSRQCLRATKMPDPGPSEAEAVCVVFRIS